VNDTGERYELTVRSTLTLPPDPSDFDERERNARQRLTLVSSTVPWTVVLARLPSGSERRHEYRDPPLGSLTTTFGLLDDPPVTVVERLASSASVVPPSTTCVGTSQMGPGLTLLEIGAAGAHGSV
jgi:hypothetical protein